MTILNLIRKRIFILFTGIAILFLFNSCGMYKPVDARKVSPNADERVRKNLEEGKGFTLMGGGKGSGTNYEFASSNPMWRATLEILDFLPLSNVNYSGGIIITDWYNEGATGNESIKITVRFLTNQIRADGLKIIVHKKKCNFSLGLVLQCDKSTTLTINYANYHDFMCLLRFKMLILRQFI